MRVRGESADRDRVATQMDARYVCVVVVQSDRLTGVHGCSMYILYSGKFKSKILSSLIIKTLCQVLLQPTRMRSAAAAAAAAVVVVGKGRGARFESFVTSIPPNPQVHNRRMRCSACCKFHAEKIMSYTNM